MANIRELKATVMLWLIIYAITTRKVFCECENPKIVYIEPLSTQTICDFEIKTSSESDQCQPSNGPYCFSLKNDGELQEPNGCPLGGPKVECQNVSCNTENKVLKEFAKHLDFLTNGQIYQQNEESYNSCGPAVANNSIEFHQNLNIDSQMNCTHTVQHLISLNASGSTLIFLVDLIEQETQFDKP